jgi:hypothetical protein
MTRDEMIKYAANNFGSLPAGMMESDYEILASLVEEGVVELSAKISRSRAGTYIQPLWKLVTPRVPTQK